MDLLKALKNITFASVAGLFALGATAAHAANDTSALGHISASVQGNLSVVENAAMRFGNFSVGGDCATGCAGGRTIVLAPDGGRATGGAGADTISLLVGTDDGTTDAAGIADGVAGLGTGAQSPGFFTISNTDGLTNVYITFSNNSGAVMDTNHPNNYVSLDGPPAGTDNFRVHTFTWEEDDTSAAGPSGSGYTATGTDATDIYGNYAVCGASCVIRVGATLATVAGEIPTPGQYVGTYYMMVSY